MYGDLVNIQVIIAYQEKSRSYNTELIVATVHLTKCLETLKGEKGAGRRGSEGAVPRNAVLSHPSPPSTQIVGP